MDDFSPPTQESIWKVTRQLKKEQSSLYNCVASVLSDAAFVSEVRDLYPTLPLLANLRCGLWYTRQADGTCYFKSTDGHNGNWSFSCTRLNWHVCEMAAKRGGVIIVDATRKGKRFPDAMTKTIPIWAAVVNRAIARKRAEAAARMAAAEALAAAAAPDPAANSAGLHQHSHQPCTQPAQPARQNAEPDAPGQEATGMTISTSPNCGLRRQRASASAPTLRGVCQSWLAAEPDAGVGCARVGSLSQWLQSPMATAAKEDDGAGDPRSQCTEPSRPVPVEALLQGCCCAGQNREPGGGPEGGSACGPDLPGMELHAEASFGDVEEGVSVPAATKAVQQQQNQQNERRDAEHGGSCPSSSPACPPADQRSSAGGAPAAWCSLAADPDPPCCPTAPVPAVAAAAADSERPAVAAPLQLTSPFALAAASATPLTAAVTGAAAAPAAATAGGAPLPVPAAVSPAGDSVDLAAASASHVSCSPEESWRCGGLFGGVVDDCDSELLLRCYTCGDWTGACVHCRGHQQRQEEQHAAQHDSDADAEGSAGSCSDTCGTAAAFSGLASTRTCTSSSSSSSLYGSRSSSCSSDQSDSAPSRAGRAVGGAGSSCRNSGGCIAAEPANSGWNLPRNPSCSSAVQQPWSPGKSRLCGSLLTRGAACSVSLVTGRASGSSNGSDSSCGSGSSRGSSVWSDAAVHSGCHGRVGNGCQDGRGQEQADDPWDMGLHLPLWISSNERAQIEKRLDGWVDSLLRVGADVEGLARVLHKPLRPLWISQASTIWVDQVAQPDQLPFTPLYLVSASLPHSYVRQAGGVLSGSDADGDSSDSRDSGTAPRRPCGTHQRRERHHHHQQHHHHQPHSWTYVYVPGAGDDEESWAAGLTPAVFWAHYTELLQAGPAGVHDAVRHVLQREATALAERGTNSTILATAATHGSASAAPVAGTYAAATDEHHLVPAGCRGGAGATAAAGSGPTPGPGGLYLLGSTGIALGALAAGAPSDCWSHVDAVLSCGLQQHPSMVDEPQWPRPDWQQPPEGAAPSAAAAAAALAAVVIRDVQVVEGPSGVGPGDGAMGALAGELSVGRGLGGVPGRLHPEAKEEAAQEEAFSFQTVARCGCGEEVAEGAERVGDEPTDDAAAGRGCEHPCHRQREPLQAHTSQYPHQHHHHHRHHHHQQRRHAASRHRQAPRYLHLPVEHYKHNRTGLAQHLDTALEFLSYHLSRGHRVLIHDTNGLDTCVCVATALLLACFGPCSSGGDTSGPAWARPYSASNRCGGGDGDGGPGAQSVSKDDVRQRLAFVSSFYPPARPTRGMLRQVYNHFVRGALDGSAEADAGGDAP